MWSSKNLQSHEYLLVTQQCIKPTRVLKNALAQGIGPDALLSKACRDLLHCLIILFARSMLGPAETQARRTAPISVMDDRQR